MTFEQKRAVVTGGAGFIGSHVVEALVSAGARVLAVDNLSTGQELNLAHAKTLDPDAVDLLQGDICDRKTAAGVAAFRPDYVFHFAAQVNVRKSVAEPDFDATANVIGTVQMCEAAIAGGAKRFVFSSTGGAIYGEQQYFPADEQHPTQPKCPYGVSKRAAELYLEHYANHSKLQTVALRFSNVYGPRQNPRGEAGVVAIFIDRLLADKTLTVYGDGKQTRDFVYVADVVQAGIGVARAELEQNFSVFNVGRGQEISVNEVVEALRPVWLAEAPRQRRPFAVEFGAPLPGEQLRSVIDPSKLAGALGWQPAVELQDGLRRTVKSFLN